MSTRHSTPAGVSISFVYENDLGAGADVLVAVLRRAKCRQLDEDTLADQPNTYAIEDLPATGTEAMWPLAGESHHDRARDRLGRPPARQPAPRRTHRVGDFSGRRSGKRFLQ